MLEGALHLKEAISTMPDLLLSHKQGKRGKKPDHGPG
jgi:hypothetical protein